MTIEVMRNFLLWCTILNYGVLVVWFVFFLSERDFMYQVHSKWFRISVEQFHMLHYALMGLFKIGILLFNLVPYIALRIASQ